MGLEHAYSDTGDGGPDLATAGDTELDVARRLLELNLQRADGLLSEEEFAGRVTELLPSP
ncbi:MAG: hypothetical protein R2726_11915 [Acidimicrobiales bacterium]